MARRNGGHCIGDWVRARGETHKRYKLWTKQEVATLRRFYPDLEKIRRLLPMRSRKAIGGALRSFNVIWDSRRRRKWSSACISRLRRLIGQGITTKAAGELLNRTQESIQWAMRRFGLVKRRPPGPARDPLVHAVRQRGFAFNLSPYDLSKSLNAKFWAGSSINWKGLWRALRLLDGKLVNRSQGMRIVWND
jgi:hypothetical protein